MRRMMGDIGQQAGLLSKIPGMKQLATAKRLRDAVQTGGLDGNPMMAGLADQLLEAAVAEGGRPGAGGSVKRKVVDKNKKKEQRRRQKQARRKSRK